LSQNLFSTGKPPAPVSEIRIENVGVNPLDERRVDVAVDLTPCSRGVDIDLVIVGPDGEELCSVLLIENREWMLDKVMHLRKDPVPGEHTLHVGVFYEKRLVTRAERRFTLPLSEFV